MAAAWTCERSSDASAWEGSEFRRCAHRVPCGRARDAALSLAAVPHAGEAASIACVELQQGACSPPQRCSPAHGLPAFDRDVQPRAICGQTQDLCAGGSVCTCTKSGYLCCLSVCWEALCVCAHLVHSPRQPIQTPQQMARACRNRSCHLPS